MSRKQQSLLKFAGQAEWFVHRTCVRALECLFIFLHIYKQYHITNTVIELNHSRSFGNNSAFSWVLKSSSSKLTCLLIKVLWDSCWMWNVISMSSIQSNSMGPTALGLAKNWINFGFLLQSNRFTIFSVCLSLPALSLSYPPLSLCVSPSPCLLFSLPFFYMTLFFSFTRSLTAKIYVGYLYRPTNNIWLIAIVNKSYSLLVTV